MFECEQWFPKLIVKRPMEQKKKLISLVIPVFNEEENVFPLYQAALPIMMRCSDTYDFELIFTDNCSRDRTFERLRELHLKDPRVRVFRFSRNFGYQKSILTGYLKSRGDAVIQLDCDLQDPPELIPIFLEHWEKGNAVVYGVRRSRQESSISHYFRRLFYRVANYLSDGELPVDAGDFRLIDRRIVEILRQSEDAQPYLRGAVAAMGFQQYPIPYDRRGRERGVTNFKFKDMVNLALDGILNHSIIPLRLATYFGMLVSIATLLAIAGYSMSRLFFGFDWPAGFTTLAVFVLAGISINALFLGIIGEYIGRIYQQVKKRPLVLIDSRLDSYENER